VYSESSAPQIVQGRGLHLIGVHHGTTMEILTPRVGLIAIDEKQLQELWDSRDQLSRHVVGDQRYRHDRCKAVFLKMWSMQPLDWRR
jgi:hypothetical protein